VILAITNRSGVTSPLTTADPAPRASITITERSPVVGLRVNMTPAVLESTMRCTTTAMAHARLGYLHAGVDR
jgi:hypothetical protein